MNRDQRAVDNWALLYAQDWALRLKRPLLVWVGLSFDRANPRQLLFQIKGLKSTAEQLKIRHIPLIVETGNAAEILPKLIRKTNATALVTDFMPLRFDLEQLRLVAEAVAVPVEQVDAHNIVPAWLVTDKREYGAYTLRPKINRLLPQYLTAFSSLKKHPFQPASEITKPDWTGLIRNLGLTEVVLPGWIVPGSAGGERQMREFLDKRLADYAERRNDPQARAQSELSPWLHCGQLGPQRVALEAQSYDENIPAQESFLEELIVRRELSDNFCLYTSDYDRIEGFPEWSQRTLAEHRSDPREYLYGIEPFETGNTHDPLWNAAQAELVGRGKMPGYLRMYWAKKILEWSPNAERAMATAIYLNDRYSLDGWDPNGYAGIAWSIGGVHDRAWFERDIFGKIRYMSYNGCRRKFDVDGYIEKTTSFLTENR